MSGAMVTLPAGPSAVTVLDVEAAGIAPLGVHLVEAALLGPQTGVTLARHVLGVSKE